MLCYFLLVLLLFFLLLCLFPVPGSLEPASPPLVRVCRMFVCHCESRKHLHCEGGARSHFVIFVFCIVLIFLRENFISGWKNLPFLFSPNEMKRPIFCFLSPVCCYLCLSHAFLALLLLLLSAAVPDARFLCLLNCSQHFKRRKKKQTM